MRKTSAIAITLLAAFILSTTPRTSANPNDDVQRIQDSIKVLQELNATPDKSIPHDLLDRAEAVVVIPTLVKGGFIIGAKHGKGVISARDSARGWSSPAFLTMTGGSIGWQIGVESVDLVLLVMNRDGVNGLLSDKFTIGGALSLTAGPVGRTGDAATDAKLSSQILAYSRTKGLFAGATLEGASLHPDKDGNAALYGKGLTVREIIAGPTKPAIGADVVMEWRRTLRAMGSGTEMPR